MSGIHVGINITESNSLKRKRTADDLKLFVSKKEIEMGLIFAHHWLTYCTTSNFDSFELYPKGTKFKKLVEKKVPFLFFFKKEITQTEKLYPKRIAYVVVYYDIEKIREVEIKIHGKENIDCMKTFAVDFLTEFGVKPQLILTEE